MVIKWCTADAVPQQLPTAGSAQGHEACAHLLAGAKLLRNLIDMHACHFDIILLPSVIAVSKHVAV